VKDRVRVWDLLLILCLLALCVGLTWIPRSEGECVTVSVDGKVLATLPLTEDAVYPLPDGSSVVIRNGTARLAGATCEDKLCEEMGEISHRGQTVLCLPNRISLVISGEVDAYVG